MTRIRRVPVKTSAPWDFMQYDLLNFKQWVGLVAWEFQFITKFNQVLSGVRMGVDDIKVHREQNLWVGHVRDAGMWVCTFVSLLPQCSS